MKRTPTVAMMGSRGFAGQPGGRTSDLYSVGVLLYRLVTSAYPIEARTAREIRDRHLRGEQSSLELALTGRMVPEMELDVLLELEAIRTGAR